MSGIMVPIDYYRCLTQFPWANGPVVSSESLWRDTWPPRYKLGSRLLGRETADVHKDSAVDRRHRVDFGRDTCFPVQNNPSPSLLTITSLETVCCIYVSIYIHYKHNIVPFWGPISILGLEIDNWSVQLPRTPRMPNCPTILSYSNQPSCAICAIVKT